MCRSWQKVSEEERKVHKALNLYLESRMKNITDSSEHFAIQFVLKIMKKRLFSSPAAFQATLEQHLRTLARRRAQSESRRTSAGILRQQIARLDEDSDNDEQLDDATQGAVEQTSRLFRESTPEEKRLLQQMRSWAETAVHRPDSKTRTLIAWLKKIVKPNGQWTDERVIIFTEYRDTQKWLMEMLAREGLTGNDRLLLLYGGMDSPSREKVKAAFQADPAASPVRILLATDATSEGIDLQKHCHRLVHFEISWNPNRMEQRNGRIDRHGQRASEVLIFHFVGQGYQNRSWNAATDPHGNDLEADLEFLLHAALKVENIRNDLGKVGPVIAEQVEQAMLGQRSRQLDTAAAEQAAKRAGALLKFERDVKRDLERIAEQLDETKRELRLSPENIQHVVQIALELAGQPPLREVIVPGIWPDPQRRRTECPVFHLPPLRGSWAACAEGLADPHTGKIRPIVFDPFLIEWRDDVVLCHLNHRLAQMSLRLLRAEVWSLQDRKLHRFTARLVPERYLSVPVVVGYARVVVIGGDNHRLHEEIITAGGRIQEGRFSRMLVGDTRQVLEAQRLDRAPQPLLDRALQLWPKISGSLQASLEARMRDRTENLSERLQVLGEEDCQQVTALLNELKRAIEEQLRIDQAEMAPLLPGFDEEERRQFESDRDNLRIRAPCQKRSKSGRFLSCRLVQAATPTYGEKWKKNVMNPPRPYWSARPTCGFSSPSRPSRSLRPPGSLRSGWMNIGQICPRSQASKCSRWSGKCRTFKPWMPLF